MTGYTLQYLRELNININSYQDSTGGIGRYYGYFNGYYWFSY